MGNTLCSWGAAGEVTGSKHLLELEGRQIVLDCGMFQGKRKEAREKNENFPFDPSAVESLILSHGHFDHTGAIPIIVKKGFAGNVYCTPATREISSLVMMDSAHLQAKDAEYVTKKRAKGEDQEAVVPVEPLYTEQDVVAGLSCFMTVSYHREFPVGDGIRASFYDAGHILGSALTRLTIGKGPNAPALGFTGDLGRTRMAIIRDPEALPPVDWLICESTYGNRRHDPITRAMDELAEVVNQVWERRGKLIIPAFAVERTQELVYYLHLLRDQNRIPEIPVFVDSPMAVNATSVFRTHPECYDQETRQAFLDHHQNPFGFETLRFVSSTEESKRLNKRSEPCVIISSSGMCEGGRILHHLANNVSNPNTVILIVGFMARNTLGRRLADREKEVKIFGQRYPVKARVKIINAFSAHADYEEIKAWINRLDRDRLKSVFLVHGETEAQENLKKVLLEDGVRRVEILKYGEAVELE
ncbi:MAG TPA: MBL fold metallo-hydrolase [bacterium]|nr:MBL fold metallo-hydrolase [bacterium]